MKAGFYPPKIFTPIFLAAGEAKVALEKTFQVEAEVKTEGEEDVRP